MGPLRECDRLIDLRSSPMANLCTIASDDHLRSNAVRQLIEDEILTMLQDRKMAMLERVVASSPVRLAAISNGRKPPQKQD